MLNRRHRSASAFLQSECVLSFTILCANSADDIIHFVLFCISSENNIRHSMYEMTKPNAWKKIREYYDMSSAENLTQHAKL